jgi:hypothetical protein
VRALHQHHGEVVVRVARVARGDEVEHGLVERAGVREAREVVVGHGAPEAVAREDPHVIVARRVGAHHGLTGVGHPERPRDDRLEGGVLFDVARVLGGVAELLGERVVARHAFERALTEAPGTRVADVADHRPVAVAPRDDRGRTDAAQVNLL